MGVSRRGGEAPSGTRAARLSFWPTGPLAGSTNGVNRAGRETPREARRLSRGLTGPQGAARNVRNTGRTQTARLVYTPTPGPKLRSRIYDKSSCVRCGVKHRGPCAHPAPPRSRAAAALAAWGHSTERAWSESRGRLRQRALEWASGLVTSTGRDIGMAIATCGRPVAALYDGKPVIAARRCRARACPRCQYLRSCDLSARLRAYCTLARAQSRKLWFVTLTVPKPHGTDPRVALEGILSTWRQCTNTKTKAGRRWRELIRGGVRSVEVTFSRRGDQHGGHTVRYTGYHAHIHCVMEADSMADVWAAINDIWLPKGGGLRDCQDVKRVDDRRLHEMCTYVCKPLTARDNTHARNLYAAMHGMRMMAGFGTMYHWRREADELIGEPEGELLWATGEAERPGKPTTLPVERVLSRWLGVQGTELEQLATVTYTNGKKTIGIRLSDVLQVKWQWLRDAQKSGREEDASRGGARGEGTPRARGSDWQPGTQHERDEPQAGVQFRQWIVEQYTRECGVRVFDAEVSQVRGAKQCVLRGLAEYYHLAWSVVGGRVGGAPQDGVEGDTGAHDQGGGAQRGEGTPEATAQRCGLA